MKNLTYLFVILILVSCSSVRMIDSWKNEDYSSYKPKKVLIVGITESLIARKKFENQLKTELQNRNIEAIGSYDVFTPSFTVLKQTEEEIEKEIERITKNGFDTVLISVVKGIDEKVSYSGDNFGTYNYWRRFGRYYYLAQDVYLVEGYYSKYKIYHIEASLYNLNENNDKSLVWVASYDIVNPENINNTVNDYVSAIIKSLEHHQIITKN